MGMGRPHWGALSGLPLGSRKGRAWRNRQEQTEGPGEGGHCTELAKWVPVHGPLFPILLGVMGRSASLRENQRDESLCLYLCGSEFP